MFVVAVAAAALKRGSVSSQLPLVNSRNGGSTPSADCRKAQPRSTSFARPASNSHSTNNTNTAADSKRAPRATNITNTSTSGSRTCTGAAVRRTTAATTGDSFRRRGDVTAGRTAGDRRVVDSTDGTEVLAGRHATSSMLDKLKLLSSGKNKTTPTTTTTTTGPREVGKKTSSSQLPVSSAKNPTNAPGISTSSSSGSTSRGTQRHTSSGTWRQGSTPATTTTGVGTAIRHAGDLGGKRSERTDNPQAAATSLSMETGGDLRKASSFAAKPRARGSNTASSSSSSSSAAVATCIGDAAKTLYAGRTAGLQRTSNNSTFKASAIPAPSSSQPSQQQRSVAGSGPKQRRTPSVSTSVPLPQGRPSTPTETPRPTRSSNRRAVATSASLPKEQTPLEKPLTSGTLSSRGRTPSQQQRSVGGTRPSRIQAPSSATAGATAASRVHVSSSTSSSVVPRGSQSRQSVAVDEQPQSRGSRAGQSRQQLQQQTTGVRQPGLRQVNSSQVELGVTQIHTGVTQTGVSQPGRGVRQSGAVRQTNVSQVNSGVTSQMTGVAPGASSSTSRDVDRSARSAPAVSARTSSLTSHSTPPPTPPAAGDVTTSSPVTSKPQKVSSDTQTTASAVQSAHIRRQLSEMAAASVSRSSKVKQQRQRDESSGSLNSDSTTASEEAAGKSSSNSNNSASSVDSVVCRPTSSCDEQTHDNTTDNNSKDNKRSTSTTTDHIASLRSKKHEAASSQQPAGKDTVKDTVKVTDVRPMPPIVRSAYLRATSGAAADVITTSSQRVPRDLAASRLTRPAAAMTQRQWSNESSPYSDVTGGATPASGGGGGYMSDGDIVRVTGAVPADDVNCGYMSEGGVSLYMKRMQQRFREGMLAVRESLEKNNGLTDDDR